jgi:hypothetical protein
VRCVLFVCCVLLYNHCHRVKTHLQLINITYLLTTQNTVLDKSVFVQLIKKSRPGHTAINYKHFVTSVNVTSDPGEI